MIHSHMDSFSLSQAMAAQQALRQAANLPAEQFPLPAFVGMISDEIESLRKNGKTDEDIAQLVNQAAQTRISAADIERYYAPPEERARG